MPDHYNISINRTRRKLNADEYRLAAWALENDVRIQFDAWFDELDDEEHEVTFIYLEAPNLVNGQVLGQVMEIRGGYPELWDHTLALLRVALERTVGTYSALS